MTKTTFCAYCAIGLNPVTDLWSDFSWKGQVDVSNAGSLNCIKPLYLFDVRIAYVKNMR